MLLVACAVPLNRLIGWADGRLMWLAHYNSEWYRRAWSRELALVSARRLFWLAAVVALGAWLLRRPCGRWCQRVSGALEAVARAPRKLVVGLAAAAFLALALAYVWRVGHGEPDYPDAHGYLFQARGMAAGLLTSPVPASADFFDPGRCPHPTQMGFVFIGGRWFFCGLPFAPALYAAGLMAGCVWLVPPLLGAAAVVLAYFVGKDCFGGTGGLIAMGLCLTSGWLVIQSGDYMTHVPCLVPMLAFMVATRRVLRGGSRWWAAGAGLALGLGAAARPATALALCVPFAAVWAAWLLRSPRRAWAPTAVFAAALALPIGWVLAHNAATTGNAVTFGYQLGWGGERPSAPGREVVPGWRWRPMVGVANLLCASYFFGPAALDWPVPSAGAILAAAALLGIWRGRDGDRWPLVVGLAALALVVGYSRCEADPLTWQFPVGPRQIFEALPLVMVLGAGALLALHGRLVAAGVGAARARAVLGGLIAFFVAWGAVATLTCEVPKLGRTFSNPALTRALAGAAKPAVVFIPVPASQWEAHQFAAAVLRNDPAMIGPVIYARDLGERNKELAAAYPGRHLYRWDAEAGALAPLALAPGAGPP